MRPPHCGGCQVSCPLRRRPMRFVDWPPEGAAAAAGGTCHLALRMMAGPPCPIVPDLNPIKYSLEVIDRAF